MLPLTLILFVILLFVCVAIKPDVVLFIIFFAYGLSGLLSWLRKKPPEIKVDEAAASE